MSTPDDDSPQRNAPDNSNGHDAGDNIARADDPTVVTPTLDMLVDVARIHGMHFSEGADRLLLPWELHRHLLAFTTAPRAYLLSVAQLRCRLSLAEVNSLVDFLSTWNAERINPTGMFHLTDEGDLSVQFRSHLAVGAGISMQQLSEFFLKATDTSHMAIDELRDNFGEAVYEINDIAMAFEDDRALRTELVHRYAIDSDDKLRSLPLHPDFYAHVLDGLALPAETDDVVPQPVTISRVQEIFAEVGIENSDAEGDFLVTAINEIFLAAFIDNGPSLLIRGHWDANLDPEVDRLRAFLATNDWNYAAATTRALWQEDDNGLQLRVEYAVSVETGLTDAQLEENLVIAMHDILKAIDGLSLELSGTSAVRWPE
ncbi:YbjN domain-containing protein [Corynebacterium epidermidicanis]|uniref:Putative bacterial sensory transduction regulator n=1 Tax=Corynebacterium epidermidicanis TaxID=1050174 RepID=A0A0G3GSB9_9CORY|nr:YbjN domain-containing protein [Corynebacterium epidermidicanis]AKK03475.1 Putative bacterial sensory transduction regulator [Corynebacterium epidermidicanis]